METFNNDAILLPFMADARAGISCTLSWDSEISPALRGNEGRGGFRALPRPKLVYTARTVSAAQSADLRTRLLAGFDLAGFNGGRGRFGVPWFGRACWLAQDCAVGSATLPLEPTPWPWQGGDGWIAFSDPQSAAAGNLWTFGSTTGIDATFHLALGAGLGIALPAGAAVFPLFVGRLDVSDRGSLFSDERLQQPFTLTADRQYINPLYLPACCPIYPVDAP